MQPGWEDAEGHRRRSQLFVFTASEAPARTVPHEVPIIVTTAGGAKPNAPATSQERAAEPFFKAVLSLARHIDRRLRASARRAQSTEDEMRFRTAIAAAALVIAPAVALAAQPLFVNVDGHVVPAKSETRVIQTAAGPVKVSTWSWHSPNGASSIVMQSSNGGTPPDWALAQMRAMNAQIQAMQIQMQQLQHAAFDGAFALPAPMPVLFAVPAWAAPGPVIVVDPGRAPAPAVPAAAPRAPGVHI